jgi:hypothetical protein
MDRYKKRSIRIRELRSERRGVEGKSDGTLGPLRVGEVKVEESLLDEGNARGEETWRSLNGRRPDIINYKLFIIRSLVLIETILLVRRII